MRMVDRVRDILEVPSYAHEIGDTHETRCPVCNHWTGVSPPSDAPPNGQHKCITWCTWCGREFAYFY
jgi:hypothetical protein